MFKDCIINARKDRYNIMCYITAHYKLLLTYVDDSRSGGCRAITENETTAELKPLDETLKFIYFWLKHFRHNYQVRRKIYNEDMIFFFKKAPTKKSKQLSQD